MDTSDVIKAKLKALGESYDALRPFMLKRLEAVEVLIQQKRTAQQEALASLKETDFSIAAISRELQMSRTTLYNHGQLLKRYIEYSAKQADAEDPFAQLERAASDKADLQAHTISEKISRQNKRKCGILKQGDRSEEIYHNKRRV